MALWSIMVQGPAPGWAGATGVNAQSNSGGTVTLGVGVTGGLSLYYPSDVNELADDIYEDWIDSWGAHDQDLPQLRLGVSVNGFAQIGINELLRIRPWLEYFNGGSKELLLNESLYYDGEYFHAEVDASFSPSYLAPGITFYLTPSLGSGARFAIGAGAGYYMGSLKEQIEWNFGDADQDSTITWKGETVGLHGTLGVIIAPTSNLELEAGIYLRYADVDGVESDDGVRLRNSARNKDVSLSFTGCEIRLGGTLVFDL